MRTSSIRRAPRKVATNLSVRADLVRRARAMKLNLSQVMETALDQAIQDKENRDWVAENREAIDQYNAVVAKRGVFGDAWRNF
jgi:antitoxin CcdA